MGMCGVLTAILLPLVMKAMKLCGLL